MFSPQAPRDGFTAGPQGSLARLPLPYASASLKSSGRGGKKNAARVRGVFQVTRNLLLRDGATEHPVDLLVRGIAAGLAGLRGREGLVGSALCAARRLVSGLGSAVGRISGALRRGQIGLQAAYLTFEVIDLSLQGLEVRATSQHGYDRCSGHFHNDRALHTNPLLGCWFGKIPETTRAEREATFMPAFARAQLHQICHGNATGKTHECLHSATVACRLERSVSRTRMRKIFHAR